MKNLDLSLKLEIEPAAIAWSAGRDTMEVFNTAFVQASSGGSCHKGIDDNYLETFRCWASSSSVKSYTVCYLKWLLHSIFILHMVFGERGEAFVKTIHWSFLLLVGNLSPWGKTKSFVYSHNTDHFCCVC